MLITTKTGYQLFLHLSKLMKLNIGDRVSSESRKDSGTVINKTRRSITIKWGKSAQKITFDTVPWDWSDYDYKKV